MSSVVAGKGKPLTPGERPALPQYSSGFRAKLSLTTVPPRRKWLTYGGFHLAHLVLGPSMFLPLLGAIWALQNSIGKYLSQTLNPKPYW